MVFAPVAPIQILESMKEQGDFGYYHLFLAHHTLEHPGRFQRLVEPEDENVRRIFIMDNSIVELGDSCTAEVMLKACKPILDGMGPRDTLFAVLPDVMGDGYATRHTIEAHYDTWRSTLPEQVQLMAVAQGSNWLDYCQTIDYLKAYTDSQKITGVGIPRVLTNPYYLGTRKQACFYASLILQNNGLAPWMHLLGFSDNVPDDLLNAAHFGWGIDSAVPLRVGSTWSYAKPTEPRDPKWFEEGTYTDAAKRHVHELRKLIG